MTLAEAQANLNAAKSAYTAALTAAASSIGDVSVTRQRISSLAAEVNRWERTVAEITARANGAKSPGVAIATWS